MTLHRLIAFLRDIRETTLNTKRELSRALSLLSIPRDINMTKETCFVIPDWSNVKPISSAGQRNSCIYKALVFPSVGDRLLVVGLFSRSRRSGFISGTGRTTRRDEKKPTLLQFLRMCLSAQQREAHWPITIVRADWYQGSRDQPPFYLHARRFSSL